MYHVELAFKGFVTEGEFLTKLPIRMIKSPHIFIEEFRVFSERASGDQNGNSFQYYFEAAALMRIDRDDVIEAFLEEVGLTLTHLVAKHQVKIITSDISFEHDGIEAQSLDHLQRVQQTVDNSE